MSTDRYSLRNARERAAICWRAILRSYRIANNITHHALGALLTLLVIVYFVFCGLILAMRYVVLPNIDRYKPEVEQMATRAVGRPVSISTIHASWHGLMPNLLLNNVVIHNREGVQALSLPRVSATLSWWSIAVADLRLHSLEIVRPDMDIDRDKDGNLYIAGILIDREKKGDGKGLDWLLAQREIVIRDGSVRWNDAMRGAPELVLNGVDFVLRNHWLQHRFALKATPPAQLAAPIDIRADFSHPPFAQKISDVSQWTGTLYADWRDTDLAVWNAYVDYPIQVYKGKGSIRAWLDFDRAAIADFTADLTLANVSARLRKDLETLDLVRVAGRVSAREYLGNAKNGMPSFAAGHSIALTDFSLETSDGLKLPSTTISESYIAAIENQPEKAEIKAATIDLQIVADLIKHLPLAEAQRRMLADLSPKGILKDFSARWQGSYPDLSSYSVKGQFAGLSIKGQAPRPAVPRPAGSKSGKKPAPVALPDIPGFDNLTGSVDANEKGGAVMLASRDAKLDLPALLAEPTLPFERLNMDARWSLQGRDRLLLQVNSMDFIQEGVAGSLSGRHVMPIGERHGKSLGTIDMSARISEIDISKVARYLPLNTPEKLRAWLAGALLGGTARDVEVALKGNLADFPFRTAHPGDKSKGVFSVSGKINDGKLDYGSGARSKSQNSPLWPFIEGINGNFLFDRARLTIKADSASTHGVALSDVEAGIDDLVSADRKLAVSGNAAGPLQEFIGFTNDSPVADWIGHFTEETKASGNAKLSLKLQLPLAKLRDAKVRGTLQFAGNDVTLQTILPPILQTGGELVFHEKGFELNGIRGNFLGGAAAVAGGTQRDGNIAVKIDGALSTEGLRKTYPAPAMQRLFQHITGNTRYTALVNVKKHRPEIVVESGLQGIALDFPAPLHKAAGESLPLRFEMAASSSEEQIMRDEIRLSLGTAVAARYEREKKAEKNASWKVVRGGIGVNAPAPLPDNGVVVNMDLDSLNIDAWRDSLASIMSNEAAPAPEAPAANSDSLGISQYIEPEVLAARAARLYVMGKKLDNVVVGASHQKGVWQANIDSEQASGYVTWNESRSGRGLGRVTARLASLVIPQSAASDVSDLLQGKSQTSRMPGLDIIAENFELLGKKFGRLELTANNASSPTGREWRISKLAISNSDAAFKASGKWVIRNGESLTSLNYGLDIADAGKLLDRLGFANVLRGGKGRLDGELNWKGLPFSLDIPSMSGQLHLDMAAGQFLKVEPGAAKLLGVLSLQSLPRRLALDFRDVFSEGFAFDGIVATAKIADGIMTTDNFKMRSVSAAVLMDGSVDIVKESQNLHVAVIPDINVGAASVAYGLMINPVIGLGSFLAQLFLRDPLMRAFTLEYQITGPWKDPTIKKLERKPEHAAGTPNAPVTD